MDTNALVSDGIEDGRRVVEQLPLDGFEVTAGFWLKPAEDGQWRFYVASPAAESEPLNVAYARLITKGIPDSLGRPAPRQRVSR